MTLPRGFSSVFKCGHCKHPLRYSGDFCPDPECLTGFISHSIGHTEKKPRDDGISWRPIETAPKDGTFVDLWVSDKEWLYRIADAYFGCPEDWQDYDGDTPCWMMEDFVMDGMAYVPIRGIPTHWMPLPDPPLDSP